MVKHVTLSWTIAYQSWVAGCSLHAANLSSKRFQVDFKQLRQYLCILKHVFSITIISSKSIRFLTTSKD